MQTVLDMLEAFIAGFAGGVLVWLCFMYLIGKRFGGGKK